MSTNIYTLLRVCASVAKVQIYVIYEASLRVKSLCLSLSGHLIESLRVVQNHS